MTDEIDYEKTKMPATADKIVEEDKFRSKLRDKSVLDEIKGIENKSESEAQNVITSYVNKIDLAERFCEIIPLYYDMAKLWWRWDFKDCCWKRIDDTDLMIVINKICKANIVHPAGFGMLGISFTFLQIPFSETYELGAAKGSKSLNDISLALAFQRDIIGGLSIGVGAKFVSVDLGDKIGSGAGADAAVLEALSLGLVTTCFFFGSSFIVIYGLMYFTIPRNFL